MDQVLLAIAGLAAYMAPCLIAGFRQHHQTLAITALNILLGWTVLGWIASLVWALTATRKEWQDSR